MQCRGCRMVPGQREPPRNSPARLDWLLSARPSTRGCNRDGRQPLLSARPCAVCSACVVLGRRVQPPPARHQAPARKGPRRAVWGRRRSPGCRGGGVVGRPGSVWALLVRFPPTSLGFSVESCGTPVPAPPSPRVSAGTPSPGSADAPLGGGVCVWEDRDPSPPAAGGLPTSLPPSPRTEAHGREGGRARAGGAGAAGGGPVPSPRRCSRRGSDRAGRAPGPAAARRALAMRGGGAKVRHPRALGTPAGRRGSPGRRRVPGAGLRPPLPSKRRGCSGRAPARGRARSRRRRRRPTSPGPRVGTVGRAEPAFPRPGSREETCPRSLRGRRAFGGGGGCRSPLTVHPRKRHSGHAGPKKAFQRMRRDEGQRSHPRAPSTPALPGTPQGLEGSGEHARVPHARGCAHHPTQPLLEGAGGLQQQLTALLFCGTGQAEPGPRSRPQQPGCAALWPRAAPTPIPAAWTAAGTLCLLPPAVAVCGSTTVQSSAEWVLARPC